MPDDDYYPWPDDAVWKEINDAVLKEVCKVRVAQVVFPSTLLPNDPTEVIDDEIDFPVPGLPVGATQTGGSIVPITNALQIPEGKTKPFVEIYRGFALSGAQVSKERETNIGKTLARMAAKEIALAEDVLIFQGDDAFAAGTFPQFVEVGAGIGDGLLKTAQHQITVHKLLGAGEVQTVTITGATDGYFTLTFNGETTAKIRFDAPETDVEDALGKLSTIGGGNVIVEGGAGGPYTVTFRGPFAGQNVSQMRGSAADLKPNSASVSIDETIPGRPGPVYGGNTFKAVVEGIAHLTETAQAPKYALILPSGVYADTYAPVGDSSLVTTADRIKPLVEGGFYGTGTLPDPTNKKPGLGLLVALGGDPTSVYVGREAKAEFLQKEGSKYVFRVVERIQFVARDARALVRLEFEY